MTQCERVLQYMRDFGSITPLDAMRDLAVMRLASRVSDLRKMGYAIKKESRTEKNRYGQSTTFAVYSLEGKK